MRTLRVLCFACCVLALARTAPAVGSEHIGEADGAKGLSKGTVYIVLSVDTEPLSISGSGKRLDLDLSNFSKDTSRSAVARAMTSDWRNSYTDSEGGHPKLTWFVLTSQHLCEAADCCIIYNEMNKFRDEIARWGDEIGWHYHHTDWMECEQSGRVSSQWNQLVTFNGTNYHSGSDIELCENVLNHLIADAGIFPVSFRSGWVWEDNDFSRWLDGVVPFDLSSSPPAKLITDQPNRCRTNETDWSRSTLDWFPYHPDSADYQSPGSMRRLVSRSLVHRFRGNELEVVKAAADSGRSQIISIPLHSYSNIRHSFTQTLDILCSQFEASGTRFAFATCRDAMARVLRETPDDDLRVKMKQKGESIEIETKGEPFQSSPYVVLVGADGQMWRASVEATSKKTWRVSIADPHVTRVVCAVSSLNGASRTADLIIGRSER